MKMCMILYNTVVEIRRERYCSDMLNRFKVIDPPIVEVRSSRISYDRKEVMPVTVIRVWQSWAKRIGFRNHKIRDTAEHLLLRLDLIHHL